MNIRIKNLRLRTIIGINDWERVEKQDIVINLELELDGIRAMETDRIEDTVDYKAVKEEVRTAVEASDFFLLERLAEEVVEVALRPALVQRVDLCVDKPGALRYARSMAVEMMRTKGS